MNGDDQNQTKPLPRDTNQGHQVKPVGVESYDSEISQYSAEIVRTGSPSMNGIINVALLSGIPLRE